MKMNKKLKLFIVFVLCFAVICCAGFGIYVSDYYRANDTALEATFSDNDVTVIEKNGDYMVFTPEKPKSGLIFWQTAVFATGRCFRSVFRTNTIRLINPLAPLV